MDQDEESCEKHVLQEHTLDYQCWDFVRAYAFKSLYVSVHSTARQRPLSHSDIERAEAEALVTIQRFLQNRACCDSFTHSLLIDNLCDELASISTLRQPAIDDEAAASGASADRALHERHDLPPKQGKGRVFKIHRE